MVRRANRKTVDRTKAQGYRNVAANFYEGAQVAAEFEYWNAAGVLIVHSAIAYGDALSIRFGGVKASGEDHQLLVNLLKELIADSKERDAALRQLSKIIHEKNKVSYSGEEYRRKDITPLMKLLTRFHAWAESLL